MLAVFIMQLLKKTSPNSGRGRTFLLCRNCEVLAPALITLFFSEECNYLLLEALGMKLQQQVWESFKASWAQASLISGSPEITLNSSKDESKCK